MARSFSEESRSDSNKIGEARYRMSHVIPSGTIARIALFAGVLLAVMFLASQSLFPVFAQEMNQGDETIDYDENGTDPVVVYTAMDPEGEGFTWTVADAGTGTVDFDMTDGVLTFKSAPNFEDAGGGDDNDSNQYIVTITVTDTDDEKRSHSWEVTVNVKNLNEPGEVELDHFQPKEGTGLTATLMDADREIDAARELVDSTDLTAAASTTWQWYRSETTAGPWTKIEKMATSSAYTPVMADVGHYLRATAMYFDYQDTDEQRTAHGVSAEMVEMLQYVNKAPEFRDDVPDVDGDSDTTGAQITMSVPEDESLEEGDDVGKPITATDIGPDGRTQEVLTYTITGGDNADLFDIDNATGQLELADADDPILDFERTSNTDDYEVVVTATDPDNLTGEATVTIRVTGVDEAPVIAEDTTTYTVAENTPVDTLVLTYNASDEDADDAPDSLSWSLSGNDADDFSITETGASGALTFISSPNFEAPADRNRNNVYEVTVSVADDAGNKASRNVTVTITNQPEDSSVTLTSHPQPEVGQRITVKLDEPDGVNGGVRWDWEVGTATSSQSGGTTANYTPRVAGALSVTATYTDKAGTVLPSLALLSPPSVQLRPDSDSSPTFPSSETGARTIAENTAGTVGDPVTATDDDDATLLYTLGGPHASLFTINRLDGQISVASDDGLNYEERITYSVTVTATDPTGGSHKAIQPVTITVTNVDEPPEITAGETEIEYDENDTGNVGGRNHRYTATDDENDKARPRVPLTWTLTGPDADDFDISNAGVLTFESTPDFENPDDTDEDNEYEVTVTVSDGDVDTVDATQDVTVTVIDVDEPGEISGLPAQPKEGVGMTVTLSDPDGGETGDGGTDDNIDTLDDNASTTWQWSRSRSNRGGWTTITATSTDNLSTTTPSRTPEAADVGHYLRATAMYSDGQGKNKVAHGITSRTVVAKEYVNSAPMFASSTITMMVMEDDTKKAGDPVGDPVTAKDMGQAGTQEVLIYTVDPADIADDDESADQALFTIDRRSGQLKLAGNATLNYEDDGVDTTLYPGTDHQYQVTVMATDPSSMSSTTVAIIMVENVEEAPEFGEESKATATALAANLAATSTVENGATTTVLSTYTASDDEDDNAATPIGRTWSLEGADKDRFALCYEDSEGATCTDATDPDETNPDAGDDTARNVVTLRFKEKPNFEMPADSGANNVYNVTVVATDRDEMMAKRPVTVTVTNKDEAGTVKLSHIQPEVGTRITARLTDPDGGERGVTWEWLWCENDDAVCDNPTKIPTTSATYTPIEEDGGPSTTTPDGRYLLAKATYTDRTSTNAQDKRTAAATSTNPVQDDDTDNQPPVLPDQTQTRTVDENSPGNTLVGKDPTEADNAVGATDVDDDADKLLYTLSGTDAALFTIHSGGDDDTTTDVTELPGQIRLKSDTELDYETKSTYRVTVTATDPSLARDTVGVNIEVIDVDEAPFVSKRGVTATGQASVSYPENGTAVVHTYRAVGPDASGVRWSLSGADRDDFTLSAGALSFNSPPDHESPTDANTDNVYSVTIMVTSGDFEDDLPVTVTVTNVDEDGAASISPASQPRVGVELTASLTDEDGAPTGVSWQWSRSTSNAGPWANISGATAATYTPVDADANNYLQATASYTDPQGAGKSASAVTSATVLAATTAGTDGTVSLSPSSGLVSGASVTATLTDADSPTNQVWVWQRSANGSSNWATISGATSASYTTTNADAGNFLRASVTYDDDSGAGQTAESPATTGRVAIDSYDRNSDGRIDAREVVAAVTDYFGRAISLQRVLQVVALYFSGLNK